MPVREGHQVARRRRAGCFVLAIALLAGGRAPSGQSAPSTSETLEALSRLARASMAAGQFDKAAALAAEAREQASIAVRMSGTADWHLWAALGSAIEVTAFSLAEQGGRSDAVYFLRNEWDAYRDTPIGNGVRADLDLVSLEGRPAPALEPGVALGPRLRAATESTRQPTLLFFWAHWCADCKAESPMIAKLVEKYRGRGLALVAPTRRYGYVEAGRPAAPAKELPHILHVRDSFYPFLKHEPVPVTDANYKAYGVSSIPMHVLIDRAGVVQLYRPGRMTEAELEASIRAVLDR